MKLKRVILNSVRGKSVVRKYSKEDLRTVVEEVVYALPPLSALTFYYMQFILKDFATYKYPKYIKGTYKSSKVSKVFYLNMDDYILMSFPYTNGEEWKFNNIPKYKRVRHDS